MKNDADDQLPTTTELPKGISEAIEYLVKTLNELGYSAAVLLCETDLEQRNTFSFISAPEEDYVDLVGILVQHTEVPLGEIEAWVEEAGSFEEVVDEQEEEDYE